MNTVKKISTLFALALISQSSFATETTPETNTETVTEEIAVEIPRSWAYTPTDLQINSTGGDIRSTMQNTVQNASVANTSNLANEMQLSDVYGSDIMKSMTSSANAMNSNAGSSYNDSTNNITTTSTDSSTNTHTSTLDGSSDFATPAVTLSTVESSTVETPVDETTSV